MVLSINFTQGIYSYIPETSRVSGLYCCSYTVVTIYGTCNAIFHDKHLYLYVTTFRSMFLVPNIAVFCSYLMSYLPGMLFRYFLNDSEMVPVAAIINGVAHVVCIPHALYLYCKVFLYVLKSFQLLSW